MSSMINEKERMMKTLSVDLSSICRYFGIERDLLKKRLITKRLEFKEQQENRRIEQQFTLDKAIFSRDALAKGIYARLFDYLIQVGSSYSY